MSIYEVGGSILALFRKRDASCFDHDKFSSPLPCCFFYLGTTTRNGSGSGSFFAQPVRVEAKS